MSTSSAVPASADRAARSLCAYPWQQMNFGVDGLVMPCCIWAGYGCNPPPMGNVNNQSLQEIWNGPEYQKLRERMLSGNLTGLTCEVCLFRKFNGAFPHFQWPGMFAAELGHCCSGEIPQAVKDAALASGSPIILLENGVPLPFPDAPHAEIREKGAGRYSIWGGNAFFSASDNSFPLTNGYRYAFRCGALEFGFSGLDIGSESGKNILLAWDEFRQGASRLAAKPSCLGFISTTDCNIDCPSCSMNLHRKLGVQLREGIEEEVLSLIPYLIQLNWMGGEPLIIQDLRDFIAAYEPGQNPNLAVSFNTNGVLLSTAMLKKLRKFPKTSIVISMDSFKQTTFETIRAGAPYAAVMRNLHAAFEGYDLNWKTQAAILVQKDNILELPEIIAYAASHDLSLQISLLIEHPVHKRLDMFENMQEETEGWEQAVQDALAVCSEAMRQDKPRFKQGNAQTGLEEVSRVIREARARFSNPLTVAFQVDDPFNVLADLPCPMLAIIPGPQDFPQFSLERVLEADLPLPPPLPRPIAYTLLQEGQRDCLARIPEDLAAASFSPVWALYADAIDLSVPLLAGRLDLHNPPSLRIPRVRVAKQPKNSRIGNRGKHQKTGCVLTGLAWYEEGLRAAYATKVKNFFQFFRE